MKTQSGFLRFLCLCLLLTGMLSCEQKADNQTHKKLTLDDFRKAGKVWSADVLDSLTRADGDVPFSSPANALVPLVFDKEGYLYSPESYNRAIEDKSVTEDRPTYYTDLKTFRELTDNDEANERNVINMAEGSGKNIYLYDAYRRKTSR